MRAAGVLRQLGWVLFVASISARPVLANAGQSGHISLNRDHSLMDVRIEDWPLARILRALSAAAGWHVYVSPDTTATRTAQFRGLKTEAALRTLLGELNFALLPQVDGSAALHVFRASQSEATALVEPDEGAGRLGSLSTPIPAELILVLRRSSNVDVEALARRFGATLAGEVHRAQAFRLRFIDAGAADRARLPLATHPDVASVETNLRFLPPSHPEPGIETTPPILALRPDTSPSHDRIVIGLIDSAVQPSGTSVEGFFQPGVSVFGPYHTPDGPLTHGTAMAHTILAGAQQALQERGRQGEPVSLSILPVDVYGASETTTSFDVARGVATALDHHVNVVNLSLGGTTDSPLLREMISVASRRGVLFFTSAGNEPVSEPVFPAADPGVVSVTAADPDGRIAPYANFGTWVDAIAPGSNTIEYANQTWVGQGTSFSSSWVSGWAAGTMVAGGHRPASVRSQTLARWRR